MRGKKKIEWAPGSEYLHLFRCTLTYMSHTIIFKDKNIDTSCQNVVCCIYQLLVIDNIY